MSELAGKTALVTGAAQGIGAATAAEMAEAGARVISCDIQILENAPSFGRGIQCDIADAEEAGRLFRSIASTEGQLDYVVNAAGILSEAPIGTQDIVGFDRIIGVNLRGSYLMAQGAARMMRAAGKGHIILISSELAYLGRADYSAYCASKAGVVGLTRALARELAPDIQVNSVAPGPVDTPMLALKNMSQEWIEKEFDVPLGRIGTPQEIAALIRFLCGPHARFFTGQTLSPNGGAVMI